MIVIFGTLLPLLLFLGVIVVDVGNWWVHKRHLQTQVDAAVFAGGSQFVGCYLNPADANAEIKAEALKYAGDYLRDPNTTNLQVQQPGDVRVALNSATYWAQANGMDASTGYTLDDTITRIRFKPIWVTEASNNKAGTTLEQKAQQYLQFWQELQKRPTVQGVTFFVASASDQKFAEEVWVGRGLGRLVGKR